MHGLPLAMAVFERKRVASVWSIVTTGAPEAVGVKYHSEGSGQFTFQFAVPGWFLLVFQAETGGNTTEIELMDHNAETVHSLGRWRMAQFAQVDSITVNAAATSDPSYTTLTRQWQPFERVAIPFLVRTLDDEQNVSIRVASGLTSTNQTWVATIWRLHDWEQPYTQNPNCSRFDPSTVGGVTFTRLPADLHRHLYATGYRYRVVGASGGKLVWSFGDAVSSVNNQVLPGFTYTLTVRIVTSPGETATGTVSIEVRAATSGAIHSGTRTYNTTEAVYTTTFATRSAGDPISEINITAGAGDKFDIEVELDVTS